MIGAALAIAISLASAPEGTNAAPSNIAILGQGGLTAGLDESGALSVLRWPGPGGPDQMRHATAHADDSQSVSIGGGRWGIEVGGRWHWFGDLAARTHQGYVTPGSAVAETTVEWPAIGLTVRQRAGVLPGREVFVSAIEIHGATTKPRVAWIAEFSPSTHQIPELALGDEALDATRGFAAFADRGAGRVWSFRPQKPGEAQWARARGLVASNASPEAWKGFGDGTWIALTAGAPVVNVVAASSSRELVGALANGATLLSAAAGRGGVGIETTPIAAKADFRAWIAVGVGAKRETSESAMKQASDEAAAFFELTRMTPGPPARVGALDAGVLPIASQHWMMLRALRDTETGLTVRGMTGTPPFARDWPREGALAAWAFCEAGDRTGAEKSIEAYLAQVRMIEGKRGPRGSMPESVYTNGELASPHFVVDDRGPARVLWVADRMLRDRPADERAVWAQKHWKAIEAAAEFLSTWMDSRRGAPLWSADPVGLSDGETQERVFAAFGGMSAALRLAGYAGQSVPETWAARRAQLLSMTEWILGEPGKWRAADAMLLEVEGVSTEHLARAREICEKRLENPIGLDRRQLARMLLQRTVLAREAKGAGSRFEEGGVFWRGLGRLEGDGAAELPSPDAFVSSATLLALLLGYSS